MTHPLRTITTNHDDQEVTMNKYTELRLIEKLAKIEQIINARDGGNYDVPLTVGEYVTIKLFVQDALSALRNDILSRVAD